MGDYEKAQIIDIFFFCAKIRLIFLGVFYAQNLGYRFSWEGVDSLGARREITRFILYPFIIHAFSQSGGDPNCILTLNRQ
jgi:hypothetical protein